MPLLPAKAQPGVRPYVVRRSTERSAPGTSHNSEMRWLAVLLSIPLLWAANVRLYLKDGNKIEGDIKKTEDGYTVTDGAGKVTKVPQDKVKSIAVTPAGATPDAMMSRLSSLRRDPLLTG